MYSIQSPLSEIEALLARLDRGCVGMRGALLVLPIALAVWGALQFTLNFDEGWRRPLNLHRWDAALCVGSIAGCALLNWRFAVASGEEEQERTLSRLLELAELDPLAMLCAVPRLRSLSRGPHRRLVREVLSLLHCEGTDARYLPVAHQPKRTVLDHLPLASEGTTD